MIRITQLKIRPGQGTEELKQAVRKTLRLKEEDAFTFEILRQSVDARRKPDLFYVYTVLVTLQDEKQERHILKKCRARNAEQVSLPVYRYSSGASDHGIPAADRSGKSGLYFSGEDTATDIPLEEGRPVIVGTGPAGLFCGLLLAREGLHPILIERGARAKERTQTVQFFWDGGDLDPESNVQFGEGGAGTFSDGKLNTGIKDPDGRIRFILQTLAENGADPEILYSYRPHVGTDVLTCIVTRITDEIRERGGSVLFRTRLDQLTETGRGRWKLECTRTDPDHASYETEIHKEKITLVTSCVVLAIGHSSRDTFRMLKDQGLKMVPKAFAVGLRIQHPQEMIDLAMYGEGCLYKMPPSQYKLTHRLPGAGGVYSFCMCPGGYVVNASSQRGMLAVNGMSYHDRSSGNANSAIVVTVTPEEAASYLNGTPGGSETGSAYKIEGAENRMPDVLTGIEFQKKLETAAYRAGGGKIPLQRFEDFRRARGTGSFSFEPKVKGLWTHADLREILPDRISTGIEEGILAWDRQIEGFASPEAILAGVESRTSSPVRIERGEDCQAVLHPGLYPCGEGAGYAGGITSAAADGLRVAEAILKSLGKDSGLP